MKTIIIGLLLIGAAALSVPMSTREARAEEAGKTAKAIPPSGLKSVASGAVEDSRAACAARVPQDASAGQRMMAEQSCDRDAAERKAIQSVPGGR